MPKLNGGKLLLKLEQGWVNYILVIHMDAITYPCCNTDGGLGNLYH